MNDLFFGTIIVLFIWLLDLQTKFNKLLNDFKQLQKEYNEKKQELHTQQVPKAEEAKEPPLNSSALIVNESIIVDEKEKNQNKISEEILNITEDNKEDTISITENSNNTKEPISFIQIFSWIGGFILLLGIIFGIKYTLEKDLISPSLRVALVTLAGISMWFTGIKLNKEKVKTTSDTLCACGLCTCYSIWFAAYYFYKITPPSISFTILIIVSLSSFATAVWKNAKYIGILAQVIGFFTPFLFNNESQNIWFLILYTGLINTAAITAAVKRNWTNQLFTGLFFTLLCFLAIIRIGNILQLTAFASVFALLYLIIASRNNQKILLSSSFIFTSIGLLILGIKTFTTQQDTLPYLIIYSGLFSAIFGLISYWHENIKLCLCAFVFSFSAFIFIAITKSFIPLFIFIAITSIFFSIISSKLQNQYLQIGTMILSVLGFITLFSFQHFIQIDIAYLPYLSGFVIFFTILFAIISFKQSNETLFIATIALALIYFGFLVSFKSKLYLISITSLFTLLFSQLSLKLKNKNTMLASIIFTSLCSMLIFLTTEININYMLSLIFTFMLYYTYFAINLKSGKLFVLNTVLLPIPMFIFSITAILFNKLQKELFIWIAFWSIITTIIPYIFKQLKDSKTVWINIAISNIIATIFIRLIYRYITPNPKFAITFTTILLTIFYSYLVTKINKWHKLEEGIQNLRLSGFICAPICLITLTNSIMFSNEWRIIAFACEGFLLIWLWHKLKVNILQNIGAILLGLTTMRLLIPYIKHYEQTNLILNWYLYTYSLIAIAMFASSYFWRKTDFTKVPIILNCLGGILLFFLVNIEIACYFSNGCGLNFNFCGNVSEAATYTIAWALCGAICMFCVNKKDSWLLQTGIGLITLSVLKLFISDIWLLSSGLRILVLIGVSIIMLVVSFIYQQFKKKSDCVL